MPLTPSERVHLREMMRPYIDEVITCTRQLKTAELRQTVLMQEHSGLSDDIRQLEIDFQYLREVNEVHCHNLKIMDDAIQEQQAREALLNGRLSQLQKIYDQLTALNTEEERKSKAYHDRLQRKVEWHELLALLEQPGGTVEESHLHHQIKRLDRSRNNLTPSFFSSDFFPKGRFDKGMLNETFCRDELQKIIDVQVKCYQIHIQELKQSLSDIQTACEKLESENQVLSEKRQSKKTQFDRLQSEVTANHAAITEKRSVFVKNEEAYLNRVMALNKQLPEIEGLFIRVFYAKKNNWVQCQWLQYQGEADKKIDRNIFQGLDARIKDQIKQEIGCSVEDVLKETSKNIEAPTQKLPVLRQLPLVCELGDKTFLQSMDLPIEVRQLLQLTREMVRSFPSLIPKLKEDLFPEYDRYGKSAVLSFIQQEIIQALGGQCQESGIPICLESDYLNLAEKMKDCIGAFAAGSPILGDRVDIYLLLCKLQELFEKKVSLADIATHCKEYVMLTSVEAKVFHEFQKKIKMQLPELIKEIYSLMFSCRNNHYSKNLCKELIKGIRSLADGEISPESLAKHFDSFWFNSRFASFLGLGDAAKVNRMFQDIFSKTLIDNEYLQSCQVLLGIQQCLRTCEEKYFKDIFGISDSKKEAAAAPEDTVEPESEMKQEIKPLPKELSEQLAKYRGKYSKHLAKFWKALDQGEYNEAFICLSAVRHQPCFKRTAKIATILLESGLNIDITSKNAQGLAPEMLARMANNTPLEKIIKEHQAHCSERGVSKRMLR